MNENNQNPPLENQQDGLLKVPENFGNNAEQHEWMQEHHNANHALYYLSLVVYAVIHHKPDWNNTSKTERIMAHITCLHEFLQQHQSRKTLLLKNIYETLLVEYPRNHTQWARFVYKHWEILRGLAEHYDVADKCFPEIYYSMIQDVIHKRQWRRLWWWQRQVENLRKILIRKGKKSKVKRV